MSPVTISVVRCVILEISYSSFFLLLGVMSRVPIALHLSIAHDDDITRHLAKCDENYKFAAYSYSIL